MLCYISAGFPMAYLHVNNEINYAVSGIDGCTQLANFDISKRLKKAAYTDEGN